MPRFRNPVPQYSDSSGTLLTSGFLYFFESGTNTDKETFADVNLTIPNTQPLVLTGGAFVPNCFYEGSAKVILTDSDDVQVWERDPVTSGSIGAIGREWDAISIYDFGSVVIFNTIYYVSIINSNQNNIPSASPEAWTQFDLLKRWNVNETYQLGDPVTASDGNLYTSSIVDNLGDDPILGSGDWSLPAIRTQRNLLIGNFRINQLVLTGSVVLSAGEYGHDGFRGGSGGCTYTFATSNNVTTVTISAGTLEQEVEGVNIFTGTHVLSWTGTAQGQIDGGGFSATGVTATLTGGTNAIVEFDAGTISLPQLEDGAFASSFDLRLIEEELALCQQYFEKSYDDDVAPGANDVDGAVVWLGAVANSTGRYQTTATYAVKKRSNPTITIYNTDGTINEVFGLTTTGSTATAMTAIVGAGSSERGLTVACEPADSQGGFRFQFTAAARL